MSNSQMNGVFKKLNELFDLPEKDWEDELTTEQYFSVLLAYNDQIRGNRREKNKQGLAGKVYSLSLDEKVVLELAYKCGKSAAFDEQDVVKSLSAICGRDVAEILSQNKPRKEIVESLHNLAVEKICSNPSARQNPFAVYQKASNCYDVATNLQSVDNFRMNKSMLENLDSVDGDEKLKERIDKARGIVLDGIFSYSYDAVRAGVYGDAYQKIMSEAEAV